MYNFGSFNYLFNRMLRKNDSKEKIYLVSYPKSGNTWIRFIIGNYLTDGKISFSNYHKIIPDIHKNPEDISKVPYKPIIIKSHNIFRNDYKQVIYIYRDGRDVSVSYYHHLRGKGWIPLQMDFQEFYWEKFMKGDVFFGDWAVHIDSWLKKTKNILLIKYEDLQTDTLNEVTKILKFCKISSEKQKLIKAIDLSTKKNMAIDELKNKNNSIDHKGIVTNSFKFVRKATIGDWENYYNTKMLDAFEEKYGELMRRLKISKKLYEPPNFR